MATGESTLTIRMYCRACALGLTAALAAPGPVLAGAPAAGGGVRYVEGKASNPSSGQLMYIESHWITGEGGQMSRLVLYRCPDGKPFARKIIHANGNAQSPDFELDEALTGYREGVRGQGDKRTVYVRDKKTADERTAALKTSPMPVIDAGFDAYIRVHWDKLGKDGSDTLPFLIPSRLGSMNFSVKRLPDTTINGRAARLYELGLSNWIGFALPHLHVAYDANTRELLSFEGIANIRGSSGSNVKVKIVFDPSKDKRAEQADLDAAGKLALDGRCTIL
ncbi:hypothetical protein [Rhodanobacter sp. L36]|uniref:hypothetical protein n=1 Tax=Rhodanobacter sp. L36 TaxID=1747221 RepID=UPI00131D4EBC|nr:hypothetical protein [Rhodanobacter sp. L36]